MDCIICGNWFSSVIHNGACPACERAIKRLGLNMMPNRIKELAQAEKDGRLVVLPCKVGDTVYRVFHPEGREPVIVECEIKTMGQATDLIGRIGKKSHLVSVFLTREEAETALKKREEADDEQYGNCTLV